MQRPKVLTLEQRKKVYTEIISVLLDGMDSYYKKHPERFGDDRSRDFMGASHTGMAEVLTILNRYDLIPRKIPASINSEDENDKASRASNRKCSGESSS